MARRGAGGAPGDEEYREAERAARRWNRGLAAALAAVALALGCALGAHACAEHARQEACREWYDRMYGALRWLPRDSVAGIAVEPEGWGEYDPEAAEHPYPRLALDDSDRAWLAEAVAAFDADPRERLDASADEVLDRLENDLEGVMDADPLSDPVKAFWVWGSKGAAYDPGTGCGLVRRDDGTPYEGSSTWFEYFNRDRAAAGEPLNDYVPAFPGGE